MRISIQRKRFPTYTIGELTIYDYVIAPAEKAVFTCHTLEPAWKNNEPRESCVPDGIYPLVLEYSEKFKRFLWELYEVQGRSECKLHSANYVFQLDGCIAPGIKVGDINQDGLPDMVESLIALNKIHEILSPRKYVTIELKTL